MIGDAFLLAAVIPVAQPYRSVEAWRNGFELVAGTRVVFRKIGVDSVSGVDIAASEVDDAEVEVGIGDRAIACRDEAREQVGVVNTMGGGIVAGGGEMLEARKAGGRVDAAGTVDAEIVGGVFRQSGEGNHRRVSGDGVVKYSGTVEDGPLTGGQGILPTDDGVGIG